ncbi:MAG: ribosomal-processing cysteine protease Prp [Syntrophomonadaceae bacterium]|jgi:uncharacterized protein YsxB (DUF464 family)|nr:ribosomal-processing cysteine protease Prp [Syntrophomonadaceae bacterium]
MVIAKIYRSYDGRITGFDISGHSGYDQWGRDIVCAGVSAVAQTALIGLLRHLPIQPDYNQDDAYLRCELPSGLEESDREKAEIILSTLEAGLMALEASYPEYVKIFKQGGADDVQN